MVLKLYLGTISADLAHATPAHVRKQLDEAADLVGQALHSVRRLILDLRPVALEGIGFAAALERYARRFAALTGLRVRVRDHGAPRELPAGHDVELYRFVQGALSNVLKHASARSVAVTLGSRRRALVMTIEDDGVGFDAAVTRQAFGLAAMRERVEGLGGRLRVERMGAPGRRRGTRIRVDVPLGATR